MFSAEHPDARQRRPHALCEGHRKTIWVADRWVRRSGAAQDPTKGPQSQPDGNMGAVQSEGIFAGYGYNANKYTIITEEGKVDARSVRRRPEPNRWAHQKIADIHITPWSVRDKAEPKVRFEVPEDQIDGRAETAPPTAPRRFRINMTDLREHGYSEGCPQCRHIEQTGRPRQRRASGASRSTKRC